MRSPCSTKTQLERPSDRSRNSLRSSRLGSDHRDSSNSVLSRRARNRAVDAIVDDVVEAEAVPRIPRCPRNSQGALGVAAAGVGAGDAELAMEDLEHLF